MSVGMRIKLFILNLLERTENNGSQLTTEINLGCVILKLL